MYKASTFDANLMSGFAAPNRQKIAEIEKQSSRVLVGRFTSKTEPLTWRKLSHCLALISYAAATRLLFKSKPAARSSGIMVNDHKVFSNRI